MQQSETYKRHRPETTLLYQLVGRYYPEFTANLAEQGKYLPKYVEREFDEFFRFGRLEHGFLRAVCGGCKHEKLVAFSCKRRGGGALAKTGAVTLIQRFGSALNLNIHFYMLFFRRCY
nr:transposase zinc-binding domain-containing protein [Glaciecola nitratireducens]